MRKVNPVKLLFGFLFVAALFYILISRTKADMVQIEGRTMGTTYSIKYLDALDGQKPKEVSRKIEEILIELNDQMSTYQKDSEISKFNKSEDLEWVNVSKDFHLVLTHALEMAKITEGWFDPTIGPLVNLWGFGPTGERKKPNPKELERTMEKVGFEKIQVDEQTPRIKKLQKDVYIDLSASAKGYGVDKISHYLNETGFSNHMVEIGGEVRTSGKKDSGDWKIAIEAPDMKTKIVQKIFFLKDKAMATSGTYRNFFENKSRRYSHAINFKTGEPVNHTLASVSVVHDNCMDADSFATALMVMGVEKGMELAEELNLAAYFIYRPAGREEGFFVEKMTSAFEKHFRSQL